jgi:chitodextrinase
VVAVNSGSNNIGVLMNTSCRNNLGGEPPTPPTVSLSIPYNIVKYTAPARIKLNAAATDKDGTITKVQFFNGNTRLHTEDVYPYGFLWIDVPVGTYTLTAKAFDNSGNVTTSNSIKVSVVEENVPPVVSIKSPVDNTTYTGPATIRLIANAIDHGDKISKVEFYSGTTLLRTEHYYPYTYWWSNVQPGTYTITAKAYDDKGLSATSKPVKIKVTNASIVSRPSSADSKTDVNGALSMRLSPVPARSTLQIYTKGLQLNRPSTVSVISASGVLMKTIQLNNLNKVVQLDVSSLAKELIQ